MLVTSSYVNVPPIERLPDMVALVACRVPIVPTPLTFNPVVTPDKDTPLLTNIGELKLTVLLNVSAVPVIILSVEATPVRPEPSPLNDVAVMIPVELICLEDISIILTFPDTSRANPDFASVSIPTLLLVLIPTETTAHVPAAPTAPPPLASAPINLPVDD